MTSPLLSLMTHAVRRSELLRHTQKNIANFLRIRPSLASVLQIFAKKRVQVGNNFDIGEHRLQAGKYFCVQRTKLTGEIVIFGWIRPNRRYSVMVEGMCRRISESHAP
eukprot:TRINITY_DN4755_c0_g1_i1.p1 TRINITY_DN4755_c0_g1~~TRINITY_DN4755_c0_g1_i1.p1  ORF type:complete len:108 (+),score=12.70 TRINITY_DN4755_c0_g1_i1:3-326(+)